MALTFLRPWMGRMMSGLCWSSGIIRLIADLWLNSKKLLGAKGREKVNTIQITILVKFFWKVNYTFAKISKYNSSMSIFLLILLLVTERHDFNPIFKENTRMICQKVWYILHYQTWDKMTSMFFSPVQEGIQGSLTHARLIKKTGLPHFPRDPLLEDHAMPDPGFFKRPFG